MPHNYVKFQRDPLSGAVAIENTHKEGVCNTTSPPARRRVKYHFRWSHHPKGGQVVFGSVVLLARESCRRSESKVTQAELTRVLVIQAR